MYISEYPLITLFTSAEDKLTLKVCQKADDKIFVFNIKKNVKTKLCSIENSKNRGKTVSLQMRWLIVSHLILFIQLSFFET